MRKIISCVEGVNKQRSYMNSKPKNNFFISCLVTILILFMLSSEIETIIRHSSVNLTRWRDHRRQKRFILFENAGISKLVTGITYPVDLGDKRSWRQLVMTYNIQYQFPVPPAPIYLWDVWGDDDRAMKEKFNADNSIGISVDEAQIFLYEFVVDLLTRKGNNGRACLQHAICENAQLNGHDGLFAELVHRILTPHKSLDVTFQDAFRLGREGVDCRTAYPEAKSCPLDQFLRVREEIFAEDLF